MIENCETICSGCGKPVAYQWADGFISDPKTVLIADWLYHAECWKDPEPVPEWNGIDTTESILWQGDGGQMEGIMTGTKRDLNATNDDDIDF